MTTNGPPPRTDSGHASRLATARARLLPVVPCLVFFLAIRLYHQVSGAIGLPYSSAQTFTEFPLLLALFGTCMVLFRERRGRAFLAALPVLALYLAHDYHLFVLDRVPNWTDFARVPELFAVLPLPGQVAFAAGLAGVGLLLAMQVDRRALRSRRMLVLVPWTAALVAVAYFPEGLSSQAKARLELQTWSDLRNVRDRGRLFMSVVRNAEKRAAVAWLGGRRHDIRRSPLFVSEEERLTFRPRDVHVVVLESYVDPSRFKGVRYSRSPLSDSFLELVGDTRSTSRSPRPVGGTAASEFEILCGVPAFSLHGIQELKFMQGAATHCLPRILLELGYETWATHPFRPTMYNRPVAYRSIGFERMTFLESFRREGIRNPSTSSMYVLDASLYDQVLDRLRSRDDDRPLFNYVLTMEGHSPFHLDESQPKVVEVEPPDELVEIFANKAYHRTEALAGYVRELARRSPDSLIIAVADHLPPIASAGTSFYDSWGYAGVETAGPERLREQFLLIVDRGEVKHLANVRHHELYQVILSSLSDGAYCVNRPCWDRGSRSPEELQADYLTLLGMSLAGGR